MINYETILSSYDNKLTLMQWLNKVQDALQNASLASVGISQPTTTTAVLTFVFADGSTITSPTLTLPQGPQGPAGEDGTSVRILPSAEACTQLGDGYIDANGYLQVLTNLSPRQFTNAGLIRGPQGPQGEQGEQGPTGATGATGADGEDGVSVTNVQVTNTNHLIVTLSNNTTIDAGEIQVSGGGGGTQLYKHTLKVDSNKGNGVYLEFLSTDNMQVTSMPDLLMQYGSYNAHNTLIYLNGNCFLPIQFYSDMENRDIQFWYIDTANARQTFTITSITSDSVTTL